MMDNAIELARKQRGILSRCFNSDAGREAIKVLERMFDSDDLRGEDANETFYNLGARDVVVFLRQISQTFEGDA